MRPAPTDRRSAGGDLGSAEASASAGRLFLGIALTDEARRAVWLHLEPEKLPGRTIRPDDWHLTLRFLGETATESLERLTEALGAAELGPQFDLVFGRLGAFPAPDRAGVLWLGVDEGTAAITDLAAQVETAARCAGFEAEGRPYAPHVTLSRLRPPVGVRPLVDRVQSVQERMAVDAIVLFRSGTGAGPGRYEALERYPLAHVQERPC